MTAGWTTQPLDYASVSRLQGNWIALSSGLIVPAQASFLIDPTTGLPIDPTAASKIVPDDDIAVSGSATLPQGTETQIAWADWQGRETLDFTIQAINGASNYTILAYTRDDDSAAWEVAQIKRNAKPEQGPIASAQTTGSFTLQRRGKSWRLTITTSGSPTGTVNVIGKMRMAKSDFSWRYDAVPLTAWFKTPAADSGNLTTIKSSGGGLKYIIFLNRFGSTRYNKLFNASSATLGTTSASYDIDIPVVTGWSKIDFGGGLTMNNGILAAITKAAGDTDATVTGITIGCFKAWYGYN
jgi:hypothetical protein